MQERDRRNPMLPSVKADAFQAADIVLQRYFTKEDFWTFVYHQETWYSYYKNLWSERSEEDVDYFLHNRLLDCRWVNGDGDLKPYPTTQAVVNEIKYQIKQIVGVPSHMQPPILLKDHKWVQQDVKGKMVCKGQIVDMRTGKAFSNHALFIPNGAEWVYDADAARPKYWSEFLRSLKLTAVEIALLQQWMGYVLSGDQWAHKGLILMGPKRSGKGTIGHILRHLLGTSMVASPTLTALAGDFGLTTLVNKRLCLVSDARLGTRADAMAVIELLLRLIANDAVDVQRKYKSSITTVLPSRVMIMSNEMPALADTSDAINSRFVILQLTESFIGREDTKLIDKLMTELPMIAKWAMLGYRDLLEVGRFVEHESANELRETWHMDNNPMSEFISDNCTFDVNSEMTIKTIYQAYQEWAEANGQPRLSSNFFSRKLTTICGGRISRKKGDNGERKVTGLKLNGKF
jgi:putative DNA primase/helicase